MLALTNPNGQNVNVREAVIFTMLADQSCCNKCRSCNGTCWRKATGSIKLCDHCTSYEITFHANIGAGAGALNQLSIAIGGEVIPYSEMRYRSTADEYGNVSIAIPVSNCCCDFDRITVVNTGAQTVAIAPYPLITVKRISKEA